MTLPRIPRVGPVVGLAVLLLLPAPGMSQTPYRKPPKEVTDILDVPPPPSLSLSPTQDNILLVQTGRYPPIADLAEPMLRLAGLRLDPKTHGPARPTRVTALSVRPVAGGEPKPIPLPDGKVGIPDWSPDGKRFVVTVTTDTGTDLYLGDPADLSLRKIDGVRLNATLGDPIRWMPDGTQLVVKMIDPLFRKPMPQPPAAPAGPTVQEAKGTVAPVRTYQDLLQNSHDEAVFEYLATSQLALVDLTLMIPGGVLKVLHNPFTMPLTSIIPPSLITSAVPSPDGKYLLVSRLKRPFSYLHRYTAFPRTIEVWAMPGKVVRTVADLPLQDKVPIEGVPTGPRLVGWHQGRPATLAWVEALDGGDPKTKVPHRDQLFTHAAPFAGEPKPGFKTEHRFAGMNYFESGDKALVRDYDRDRRWTRSMLVDPADPAAEPKVVFSRSAQDRYNDPGTPVQKPLGNGAVVLHTAGDALLLAGPGASPKGDRPFLDRFDPATGEKARLFQSGDGVYETVAAVLSDDGRRLIVRRESPIEPGNYYLRDGGKETPLTKNVDPAPLLRQAKKQLVTTRRPDGVTISFTLHLPPGYKDGERRPAVVWAYPEEFNDPANAGQVRGSPHRFTTVVGPSHLFLLTQGYVILDDVSMPVVGPPETANDTFTEQLAANAKAAIDKAAEMGVIDPGRVGVGGHSYGAFMTANLLAHSDLFRAGVARSGAYNRTLTPFGFQNERRTFWEATDVYTRMSPFSFAHKINEPLLLIHGEADNNPGTFPVQSERMYQAVRGTGGHARLVMLPHESHGYAARESVEHVLAEMIGWFDAHVKNAGPRAATGGK